MADGSVQFVSRDHRSDGPPPPGRRPGRTDRQDGWGDEAAARAPPAAEAEAPRLRNPLNLRRLRRKRKRKPSTPPTPPQAKPSSQVSPQPRLQRGERARLSLRVGLETDGEEPIRFRREGGPGELVIGLQDSTFARTLQWLIVAAVLLAAWIGRRAPGSRRAIAVVVGLAVPIGLSGLVPLAWTPLLDGLLLGALAAGCLWILLRVIAAIKMSVPGATAAALAIGVSLLLAADASLAGEARATGDTPASRRQRPSARPDSVHPL